MLHVDDNMDELFRRAAEDYPLKADVPDWENMKKKLHADVQVTTPVLHRTAIIPTLLIILMLLLVPLKLYFNSDIKDSKSKGYLNYVSDIVMVENKKTNDLQYHQLAEKSFTAGSFAANNNQINTDVRIPTTKAVANFTYDINKKATNKINDEQQVRVMITAAMPIEENTDANEDVAASIEISNQTRMNTEFPELPDTTKKEKTELIVETGVADTIVSKNKRNKYLYAGIIAGADATAIKMQPVKKIGFNAGVVVGYQINNKWSVETGLVWNKKIYDTKGEYFDTRKLSLVSNYKIDYVSGNCNMWELPLNLHYTFTKNNRLNFYASAGFSSYIMKNEWYRYDVVHNGYSYSSTREYKQSSSSFFSVINIGAGLNYNIGGKFLLRFEPYVKMPSKKVGIGSLPLQSAGINIGLTRKVF